MAYTDGAITYKLAYEISPISLTGGIAGGVLGGTISIMSLLQTSTFGGLLDTGVLDFDPDDAFAYFMPLPGSTLIENQYGQYPFANLTVAANAVIVQPLVVSMIMRVPMRITGSAAYTASVKTYIMTALQNTLAQHTQSGGLFNVATPSFFYSNCLLTKLHDVSSGESHQTQLEYQWDFWQPLVTLDQALGAQNAMMSNLSSGGYTDGSLSGTANAVGDPTTTATPSVSPAATETIGAGTGAGPVDNGYGGGAGFGGGSGGSPFAGARA